MKKKKVNFTEKIESLGLPKNHSVILIIEGPDALQYGYSGPGDPCSRSVGLVEAVRTLLRAQLIDRYFGQIQATDTLEHKP